MASVASGSASLADKDSACTQKLAVNVASSGKILMKTRMGDSLALSPQSELLQIVCQLLYLRRHVRHL
jgi:hypothetical protein